MTVTRALDANGGTRKLVPPYGLLGTTEATLQTTVSDAAPMVEQFRTLLGPTAAFGPHQLPAWPSILRDGLGHRPYWLTARQGSELAGCLPLAFVSSRLFGRFLVSLPYLNSAGVVAEDATVAKSLVDRAVQLADELDVRYLELRHEERIDHPALTAELTSKVHMRLVLPNSADALWRQLKAKVRNQVRKGQEPGFKVVWGGLERLDDFYAVFCRNMRDLGTPVYSRRLFEAILRQLGDRAELCVVYDGPRPIAAALLVHGDRGTEVPSASSLRQYNSANANMLMYWHLLVRAIERGQQVFDFGRSTIDSGTFRFKRQWGAEPSPAIWQYYVRRGDVGDMRPDNARYARRVRVWQRLPVWLTRVIGPPIVRGIP
ncbi:MAG TPA: FemAB family XrtA/PEP-CTERM system-associated protein [Pirellulales bacterium]|nr:FemAB family XrtA/PEP-CTERM system-associated protein [Pirellulales bacterium]